MQNFAILHAEGIAVVALETVDQAPFAAEYAFPPHGVAVLLGTASRLICYRNVMESYGYRAAESRIA